MPVNTAISYQFQLLLNNGSLNDQYSSTGLTANQNTAMLMRNVQTIPTSPTAIALGGVTTPGWAVFKNMDTVDYVEIGVYSSGTFYPVVKLKALEQCMFRLGTLVPYALANTASVELFYVIYAD